MQVARVIANVVSTVKSPDYEGYKILVVQPVDHKGNKAGKILLCVDSVQAGIGDLVLVVDEGGSANFILGRTDVNAIRAVVTGIVDEVDVREL